MVTKDILMDGDKMCIAWFKKKIKKFILNTDSQPPEGGTVTGAGTYPEGTVVEVEAIPNADYEFSHWVNKWSGLGMGFFSWQIDYVDTLLANGFTELRVDIPDYQDAQVLAWSKEGVIKIIAKGAKVIWGVSSNSKNNPDYTITAENWEAFRAAIKDAALWAQDNGVYEFQIGNEEEWHVDGTTMTVAQIITNLKSLATEVKAIFSNGKVSYSCLPIYINDWVTVGKGDIDILASNIYMQTSAGNPVSWKNEIDTLVSAFGIDGTYITEFNISASGLDDYSTDEAIQTAAITEMIDYIKASGMTRAFYFCWLSDECGVVKADGTYRQLWEQALLNSE